MLDTQMSKKICPVCHAFNCPCAAAATPEPGWCRYPDGSWHFVEQHGCEVHIDGVAYFAKKLFTEEMLNQLNDDLHSCFDY